MKIENIVIPDNEEFIHVYTRYCKCMNINKKKINSFNVFIKDLLWELNNIGQTDMYENTIGGSTFTDKSNIYIMGKDNKYSYFIISEEMICFPTDELLTSIKKWVKLNEELQKDIQENL